MKVEIKEVDDDILLSLSQEAREIDREEVYYQSGMDMADALELSYSLSTVCKAGFLDDKLVNVWGVCLMNLEDGIGQPWMIGTDEVENATLPFLRNCCYYLNEMQQGYSSLYNHVYADNAIAIRWLKWMGFKMQDAAPYGPFGKPFHRFYWSSE